MDQRLAALARSFGFVYTRYAHDLTFSGSSAGKRQALRLLVSKIIEQEGFRINNRKSRVARQTMTGVTVNEVLGRSRPERWRLRALLPQLRQQLARGAIEPARLAEAQGKLAYLSMLNPSQAEISRRGFSQGNEEAGT